MDCSVADKNSVRRSFMTALLVLSLVCFLVVFVVGLAFAGDEPRDSIKAEAFGMILPKERLAAPALSLSGLDGQVRTLSDYKGDVVFLHFWATWCVPCRSEMPMLGELEKDFKGKDFKIITVAVDRGSLKWTKKTVGKYIDKYSVGVDVLLDNKGDVRRLYEVSMLPTTYIIGRDGKFIGKILGGRQWTSPQAYSLFRAILK